jgi:casein kinase II subunit beta
MNIEDDMSSSSQIVDTWISNFCNLVGHEYFAEVAEDFIEDDFNLTGLSAQVHMYKEALEMILDVEPEEDDDEEEEEEEEEEDDDMLNDDLGGGAAGGYRNSLSTRRHMRMSSDTSVIENSAELLYGLIHQRYIISRVGLQQMLEKYELEHFGRCPRVLCNGSKVIPVGRTDTPGLDTVKLFCPCCLDLYTPPNSRFQQIDGAFFGTTFGCLFFMTFQEVDIGVPRLEIERPLTHNGTSSVQHDGPSSALTSAQPAILNGVPTATFALGLGSGHIYEPRIYGFRVSERSKCGPRMQWLRMKPADINQLDEVKAYHEGGSAATEVIDSDHEDEELGDVDDDIIEDDDVAGGAPIDGNIEMRDISQSQAASSQTAPPLEDTPTRRTRASTRRAAAQNRSSPMDTNGVGVVA